MEYISRNLVLFLSFVVVCLSESQIEITKVERIIDLASQLAKVNSKVTLINNGQSSINKFNIAIEEGQAQALSYLEVTEDDDEDSKLEYSATNVPNASGKFFSVYLSSSLAAGKSVTLNIVSVFTHVLKPYPAKIGQSDKQLVIYKANTYFYSPYPVKEQKTTVKLSSSTIESYSKLKPSSSSDSNVNYGPYKDQKPFASHEMKVHFENNTPFLTVKEMTRWIEVSHWGNVAVEESYKMVHEGAELKGHFSRYDFQRTPTHAAIKSFKTVLPAAAQDVYYRDEIGNISTSNLLNTDESVEVEIRPRFPLFGGWKTEYLLGYNVAVYEYLFTKGSKYVLKIRFVDHVFDDFVVDSATVKIVLPEGASNIDLKLPFDVTTDQQQVHKTYLDTSGRPVVVLRKSNLVENHIQDFEVHYTFAKHLLLQEPLLCVAAFYILFITVICIVRLDFSITKDAAKESKMKVASLIEQLTSTCDQRSAFVSSFDSVIDKFKQSKDQSQLAASLKKVGQDYNKLNASVESMSALLAKEDPELSEKLSELAKKEGERKAVTDQLVTLATRAVTGKLSKQQYTDSEATAVGKRDKLNEDIEAILAML